MPPWAAALSLVWAVGWLAGGRWRTGVARHAGRHAGDPAHLRRVVGVGDWLVGRGRLAGGAWGWCGGRLLLLVGERDPAHLRRGELGLQHTSCRFGARAGPGGPAGARLLLLLGLGLSVAASWV
jgi:hypothetical protein